MSAGPAKLEGDGTHALIVYPSSRFYDGRGADQPWLQEAPDTMTQAVWDAWVAPGTHDKLYLIMDFNPLHEPGQGNQGLRACDGCTRR